ncbi:hypothetical protein PBY51_005783 [Eleginops maclovinus]|uniref:Uncharacterized protein n=1 Tax=Eleginops maclovinus TaxID=56733 RepID=A0AAN8A0F6_ELEMC|nr:hypothetical protein PBY51_005781 [Eleginops maclovinus]KAK5848143.1 hypothetical protein PBY51_005783 [Eleginops maclovinus]
MAARKSYYDLKDQVLEIKDKNNKHQEMSNQLPELRAEMMALELEREYLEPLYQEALQKQVTYEGVVTECRALETKQDEHSKEIAKLKSVIAQDPTEFQIDNKIKLKKQIMQDNEAKKEELEQRKERLRLLGITDEVYEIFKVDTEELIRANRDLQTEIDEKTLELKSKTFMQEKYAALKELKQNRTCENEALQTELLAADPDYKQMKVELNESREAVKNENTSQARICAVKASEEDLTRENVALQREISEEDVVSQNDALQHEMQEIEREIEKEEALRGEYNAAKPAVEVNSCETEALQERLESLRTKLQDLKIENHNLKEKNDRANKELKVQTEFKNKIWRLEGYKGELDKRHETRSRIHANIHGKLLKEEHWEDMHNKLKAEVDDIELQHDGQKLEIQAFKDRLKILSVLKAETKTLEKEKKALTKLGNSMEKELSDLKLEHNKIQPLQEQIDTIRLENHKLQRHINELCEQIQTEITLPDELKAATDQNKDLSQQRSTCLQSLQEKKDSRSQS